jgi:hypothetical protein
MLDSNALVAIPVCHLTCSGRFPCRSGSRTLHLAFQLYHVSAMRLTSQSVPALPDGLKPFKFELVFVMVGWLCRVVQPTSNIKAIWIAGTIAMLTKQSCVIFQRLSKWRPR